MTVTETNQTTGEVFEFSVSTPAEIIVAYRACSGAIKTFEALRKKIIKLADPLIGDKGISEIYDGYMFRQSAIQRMNYDKAVLREVIKNEDDFDLLLEPNKKAIDTFVREHLADLGEGSTILRKSMVPVGKPYTVVKLEKV